MKSTPILILLALACCTPQKKEAPTEAVVADTATAPEPVAANATIDDVLEPEAFREKLATDPNAIVLDVRTPEEVAQGALPNAVNINFNAPDFQDKIATLDKSKPYYVYCKAGGRSSKAISYMKENGFKELHNLKGGYDAWK
ncbi:rhodanese-like domain-containing protein [Chryseolinea lacunae]|uniref:Rhodanese-like domain-containing protein n=1 Tax=Chryseolinea lacunae TaxID=2801331 RepID=A0ABS1KWM8_9BACT|nr:rhodanese-like domain-containing protein [Chryseolinea lacunae]MBL0743864.1 rhodanese-like domain-containing protein [Chryseolinea lacunae]